MRYPLRSRGTIYLLAIFALLSFTVSAQTHAKYHSSVSGSDSAQVAVAVTELVPVSANLNGTEITSISDGISLGGMKAGDTLSYHFQVRNYTGQIVSKVGMNYRIDILFSPESLSIPLTYSLTRNGTIQTSGTLGSGVEEAHDFILTVLWDDSQVGYANQKQSLAIELTSTQSDD